MPYVLICRSQVCTIASAKKHSLNVTTTIGSINLNKSSSYTNLPINNNSRFEDPRKMSCASVQALREVEEHKPITSLATSGTPELTKPNSSKGWDELVQRMKLQKLESSKNNISYRASVSMQNKDERIHNGKFHSYDLDHIAMRGASKKSTEVEQKNDVPFNLHSSVAQPRVDSERYEANNKRERGYINGLSGDASTQQHNTVSNNDRSSQTLGNEGEQNISVTCIPKAQPNGLSVKHLIEKMERSPGKDENLANGGSKKDPDTSETYVVEISAERTNGHLREKLNRIYDKVLVVDNVAAAKEIVEKLTNQYRHLVHACDTEACIC